MSFDVDDLVDFYLLNSVKFGTRLFQNTVFSNFNWNDLEVFEMI